MDKPDGVNTLYLDFYVDDIIYFSEYPSSEKYFEKKLTNVTNVYFMGTVTHYLPVKFPWEQGKDGHVSVHLSKQEVSGQLITEQKLTHANSVDTPYKKVSTVEIIPLSTLDPTQKSRSRLKCATSLASLLKMS